MSLKVGKLTFLCHRSFSTSSCSLGKKNFRKFLLYNKRGSELYKRLPNKIFYDLGVRPTGIKKNNSFTAINDMIPELIVPDLTNFKLKPYVSYRVPDVVQSEFTAQDLFNAVYAKQIIEDFKQERLEDSKDLGLSPKEAYSKARQTGSDMFYAKLDPENITTNYE